MNGQEDTSITALITKMKQKKDNLLTELEEVQQWLTKLEAMVDQGKAIIGEKSVTIPELSSQMAIEDEAPEAKAGRVLSLIKPNAEKTHAEKCKQLLEESGNPLTLAQLDELFDKRKWPIKGNNRRLVIYNSLRRNSEGKGNDWFVKAGDKKWGLKGRDDREGSDTASSLLTGL